ncbi:MULTISPECIES: glycosyltransferase [unclassified Micromonospora]|uniref:glycosyltransferase n=1 Tax=unclassified Micromonospora TaxID=2617518 RepID=UPI002FF22620
MAVAGPAHLTALADELGFQTITLSRDPAPVLDVESSAAATPSLSRARAAVGRYLRDAVRTVPELSAAARDWQADVLVRETAAWSAWLVGDRDALPVAVLDYAPTPPRLLAMLLGELFQQARSDVGLPPDPTLGSMHCWLQLLVGPPQWFPARSLGPATHILQPPPALYEESEMPSWLDELDGSRPCVYVTLGTMYDRRPGVFEAIFAALADEPVRVVATTGPQTDPGRIGHVPANVRLERFLPQAVEAEILSRTDAVVCHGGYGSIRAALHHGVPVVSIPLGNADDPTRLPGLEAMGAGIVVRDTDPSPARIAAALRRVLKEPDYRDAAREAAASIATLPPFSHAALLVERLAADRRPVGDGVSAGLRAPSRY